MLMQYQHSHLCSYRLRNVRAGYVLYRALVYFATIPDTITSDFQPLKLEVF
jgi:hypothetical protein